MSAEQLTRARDLIKAKRYEEAHAILIHLDHPTAKQWLAKIEELLPPKPQPIVKQPEPEEDFTVDDFDRFLEAEKRETTTVVPVAEHTTNSFETLTTPALITTAKKPVEQSEVVVEKVPTKSVRELGNLIKAKRTTSETFSESNEYWEINSNITLKSINKNLSDISAAVETFILSFLLSFISVYWYISDTKINYTPLIYYVFGSNYTNSDISSLLFVIIARFIITMGLSMPIIYVIGKIYRTIQLKD